MAFPQVVGTNSSQQTTDVTSHTVALPSGIVAGELLVVILAIAVGSDSGTYPAGWNKLGAAGANNIAASWGWRVADGTEGASITVTTSGAQESAHQSFRIQGHNSSTNVPQTGGAGSGTDSSAEVHSFAPTGGAKDYLFIAYAAADSGVAATSAPTSFTNLVVSDSGSDANASCAISTARRELNAASIDPDQFTLEASEGWLTALIGVHPGVEGNPAPTVSWTVGLTIGF